jgi:hypothetical protein
MVLPAVVRVWLRTRSVWGRAKRFRFAPMCSNVNLFGDSERIIDIDTKVSGGALHLCVTEEQLYGSQIAGSPINQRSLGSAQ